MVCPKVSLAAIILCDLTEWLLQRKEQFLYEMNRLYDYILKSKSKYSTCILFVKIWPRTSVNSCHNNHCLTQVNLFLEMKNERNLIVLPFHDDLELINSFVFMAETKVPDVDEIRKGIIEKVPL